MAMAEANSIQLNFTVARPPVPDNVAVKPIDAFPGYMIATNSSVWAFQTRSPARPWKAVKPRLNPNNGYYTVCLQRDGVSFYPTIHRLLLEAFIGPPLPGQQRLHADGDKLNVALSNLRWGTPQENAADSIRHGTMKRGSDHPKSRLTDEIVRQIRVRYAAIRGNKGKIANGGLSRLAGEFGIARPTVHKIVLRKTWKHVE
jgi:hypothetical protein